MWDDSIADPNWTRKLPFSNNVFTYIKIKKSPLKGMMIKGGVSLITRGYGQTVSLEPYMFAEDPDYPDQLVSLLPFLSFIIDYRAFCGLSRCSNISV